jgi:hypothetical protein
MKKDGLDPLRCETGNELRSERATVPNAKGRLAVIDKKC